LTGIRHSALIIPQRAVIDLQGQHQVAVVGPNNTVQIRKVVTGKQVGQDWIIESGLNVGEKIITEGNGKVRDGMPIVPLADSSSTKGSR
jgi:membrane fusion protein (multidrug efflux system)